MFKKIIVSTAVFSMISFFGLPGVISNNLNLNNDSSIVAHAEVVYGGIEVKCSKLNIRSGPGTNYSKIGSLSKGAYADVIGSEGSSWLKIKTLDGLVGWVYCSDDTVIQLGD